MKTSKDTPSAIWEDEELVSAMKARDEAAFNHVWQKYQRWILQRIVDIVKNPQDAEEVCQDTFFKVWQKIDLFSPTEGQFRFWIRKIAKNTAIDFLRRRKKSRIEQLFQSEESLHAFIDCCPTADEILENQELEQALEEELDGLAHPNHRLAWVLRHQEGLSVKEIAKQMGAPEGSVKVWIFRATKQLARNLQRRGLIPPS